MQIPFHISIYLAQATRTSLRIQKCVVFFLLTCPTLWILAQVSWILASGPKTAYQQVKLAHFLFQKLPLYHPGPHPSNVDVLALLHYFTLRL